MCGAKSLFKLPENISSQPGALVEPLSVGLHGVNRSGLGAGAACVVMGAGPIGLATLLWCKAKGAKTIIVSELAAVRPPPAPRPRATASAYPPPKQHPPPEVDLAAGRPHPRL